MNSLHEVTLNKVKCCLYCKHYQITVIFNDIKYNYECQKKHKSLSKIYQYSCKILEV